MSYEESSSSSSSFYQSSSGENNLAGGVYNMAIGEGLGGAEQEDYASYQSTYNAGYGIGSGIERTQRFLADNGGVNDEYYSSSSYGGLEAGAQTSGNGLESSGVEQKNVSGSFLASDANYGSSSLEQQSSSSATTTTYATDAQGLYRDPNPEVVRRPAPGGTQTYTQHVSVRFLQPPPIPPPGPLIIKEVRPPQPPPPPPLYIRQRPPPPPTLPPIVIREAPPKIPPAVGTHVITKMLPALPVPPRSVIIERLAPLPPKPRDVIVERWLPYRTQQKRRVIIQRAPPPVIQKPRNIIIYYEAPKAQVVRRFQNLGIQRVNPSEYVARYGTQLEDTASLIEQARKAGVVEDISPPVDVATNFQSSSYQSHQSSGNDVGSGTADYDVASSSAGGYNISGDFSGIEDNGQNWIGDIGVASSSSYESFSSNNANGGTVGYIEGHESSVGGLGITDNANNASGGLSSYESYTSGQILTQ